MDEKTEIRSASGVCRGCGGKNAKKPLSVYGDMFKWCTSIDVSSTDGLPSNICNRCCEMLTISYQFKAMCTRTDKHLRSKHNGVVELESCSALDNVEAEPDYEQFEVVDDVQSEEVVEEVISSDGEYLNLDLCKTVGQENDDCIATEKDSTKEIEVPESEILLNVSYLPPQEDKTNLLPLLDVDESTQPFEEEVHQKEEEVVHGDTVEYLEESYKEESLAFEKLPETQNETVSIVALKSEPTTLKARQPVRHACPDCGKHFSSRTNMIRHQHSHRSSKPYKCDICKKEFTQSGTLKTHRYSHFNIKPFVCNVCGKRFTQSKSVTLHLRCHTGEKPYACDICNSAFRQKNGLQRHMKVHGERK